MIEWLKKLFKPKPTCIAAEGEKFAEWFHSEIEITEDYRMAYHGQVYSFDKIKRIYKMRAFS